MLRTVSKATLGRKTSAKAARGHLTPKQLKGLLEHCNLQRGNDVYIY